MPVGQAGQPVRTEKNLLIVIQLCEARLLQWALARTPEASTAMPDIIIAINDKLPVSVYNAAVKVEATAEQLQGVVRGGTSEMILSETR